MKYIHCSVLAVYVSLASGCGKTPGVQNGNWKYDGTILSYDSKPVPTTLADNGINLVTPLGTFQPESGNTWFRTSYFVPLPNPNHPWVPITLTSTPCTEEMRKQGYYRVDELPIDPSSWRDTQLVNTPPGWVYAFKVSNNEERGYWITPEKLGEIDWSKL